MDRIKFVRCAFFSFADLICFIFFLYDNSTVNRIYAANVHLHASKTTGRSTKLNWFILDLQFFPT